MRPLGRAARWLVVSGVALVGVAGWAYTRANAGPRAEGQEVVVYKSPTCGCCGDWVAYLERRGFTAVAHDLVDVAPIKARLGVPSSLSSCHTATVGGYALEGHVPADLILRLLNERPAIAGLAVPGMPGGSPGMESAPKVPYDVIAFDAHGQTSRFASR